MRRVLLITLVALPLVVTPALASNDPLFKSQWGVQKIRAEEAWTVSTGAGMTVAVVDTGVDLGHEDLASKVVSGWDYIDNDPTPQDEKGTCGSAGNPGHGTHVAGIVAATTNNGKGVAGTAPAVKIMPVRVLDKCGSGSFEGVAQGIIWAADRGGNVINLSLGADEQFAFVLTGDLQVFYNAIEYAWARGAVVVVAGGNDEIFPSGYTNEINALVVLATDQNDDKATYSNIPGVAKWAMAAPGSAILSTLPGGYGTLSGTSMATPHVAGAVAVLRCLGYGKQQAIERLLATADDLGIPGKDPVFGSGRLNLAKAVAGKPAGACTGGASGGGTSGGAASGGSSSSGGRSSARRSSSGATISGGATAPTGSPSDEPAVAPDESVSPFPPRTVAKTENDGPKPLVLVALVALILAGGAYYWRQVRIRSKPTR